MYLSQYSGVIFRKQVMGQAGAGGGETCIVVPELAVKTGPKKNPAYSANNK